VKRSAKAFRVPSRGEPAPETVNCRAFNKKMSVCLGLTRTDWAVGVIGVAASIVAKGQGLVEQAPEEVTDFAVTMRGPDPFPHSSPVDVAREQSGPSVGSRCRVLTGQSSTAATYGGGRQRGGGDLAVDELIDVQCCCVIVDAVAGSFAEVTGR
jgi:hypothetical protein